MSINKWACVRSKGSVRTCSTSTVRLKSYLMEVAYETDKVSTEDPEDAI